MSIGNVKSGSSMMPALAGAAALMAAVVTPAGATIVPIELTPGDVGSLSSSIFSTLPTANPGLFGIVGSDVRFINFDIDANGNPIASGTFVSNEYASIGVTLNGIQVSSNVFGGAASAPNATTTPFVVGADLIFTFSVPVISFGAINTSPDADVLKFFSGPNGTGNLLFTFQDQNGTSSPQFNIDRFVGGVVSGGEAIQSVVYENNTGQIELDEFIFAVDLQFNDPITTVPEPGTLALFGIGLVGLGVMRRRRKKAA